MANARWTHRIYTVHKWTGLIFGLNALLFTVTGGYLLAEGLVAPHDHSHGSEAALLDPARTVPIQPKLDALLARFGDADVQVQSVGIAIGEDQHHTLKFDHGESRFAYAMDPYTGVLMAAQGTPPPFETEPADDGLEFGALDAGEEPGYSAFGRWVLRLHIDLLMGQAGMILAGVLGFFFFLSTATGAVIYGPFMKGAAAGLLRGGKPRGLSGWHKTAGAASLAFNGLMAFTGCAIALGYFAIMIYMQGRLAEFEAQAPAGAASAAHAESGALPPVDAVLASARSVLQQGHVYHITYPGGLQGDNSFAVYAQRDPAKEDLIPLVTAVTADSAPRAMELALPLWVKAIVFCIPIHIGNFGGGAVRAAYLALAVVTAILPISGFAMYAAKARGRRLARRRAAERAGKPGDAAPGALGEWS